MFSKHFSEQAIGHNILSISTKIKSTNEKHNHSSSNFLFDE